MGHPAAEYIMNCRDMILAKNRLLLKGWAAYCPAEDFLGFLLSEPKDKLIDRIYPQDLAWLDVSDAILMIGTWERSEHCRLEYERAVELGKIIYQDEKGVPDEN